MRLGSAIAAALERVGVTEERVSSWIGGACGCSERKRRLDDMQRWADVQIRFTIDEAKEYLSTLTGIGKDKDKDG